MCRSFGEGSRLEIKALRRGCWPKWGCCFTVRASADILVVQDLGTTLDVYCRLVEVQGCSNEPMEFSSHPGRGAPHSQGFPQKYNWLCRMLVVAIFSEAIRPLKCYTFNQYMYVTSIIRGGTKRKKNFMSFNSWLHDLGIF